VVWFFPRSWLIKVNGRRITYHRIFTMSKWVPLRKHEHLSSPPVCSGDRLLNISVHPRFVVEIVYWASQFTLGLLWRSFIEPLSSPSVCCGDRFSQSLVFCVVFCGPLSVFFALSLFLLFRNSDCYFGIFIPFYQQYLLKSTLLF
jgi:hypothetical protein